MVKDELLYLSFEILTGYAIVPYMLVPHGTERILDFRWIRDSADLPNI